MSDQEQSLCDDCCDQPPCPVPTLVCVSRAASEPKIECGGCSDGKAFAGIVDGECTYAETPTKQCCTNVSDEWILLTYDASGSYTKEVDGKEGSWTYHVEELQTLNDDCTITVTWSGTSTDNYTEYSLDEEEEWVAGDVIACDSEMDEEGNWSGTMTTNGGSPVSTGACHEVAVGAVTTYGPELEPPEGEEESTEEMIARVEALLEEADPGDECEAARYLPEDESSYTVKEFDYVIQHTWAGYCYLKVWVDRVFTPTVGSPTITADPSPYTWTGSGSTPCTGGSPLTVLSSGSYSVPVPAANGETTYRLRWSCVDGYEPSFASYDPANNGFPP